MAAHAAAINAANNRIHGLCDNCVIIPERPGHRHPSPNAAANAPLTSADLHPADASLTDLSAHGGEENGSQEIDTGSPCVSESL